MRIVCSLGASCSGFAIFIGSVLCWVAHCCRACCIVVPGGWRFPFSSCFVRVSSSVFSAPAGVFAVSAFWSAFVIWVGVSVVGWIFIAMGVVCSVFAGCRIVVMSVPLVSRVGSRVIFRVCVGVSSTFTPLVQVRVLFPVVAPRVMGPVHLVPLRVALLSAQPRLHSSPRSRV